LHDRRREIDVARGTVEADRDAAAGLDSCELLEEIARKEPRVMRDPAPAARVKSLGDFGVNLELTTWLGNLAEGESELRSALFRQVLKTFRDEAIPIAYRRREAAPIPTDETEEGGIKTAT